MITQTLAIFLDAYRELNSRKLFWITMALSGLVVLVYAAIGIDKNGVSFLWFRLGFIEITSEQMPPELLYKQIFMQLGLGLWLTWIATILALISTAGIVPDMITGGSIEMLLSKPISRMRLFLTKYAAGLLFATLQVGVFSVACLLVIGIRGGVWEFKLLLAIPLVIAFFSYLFSFCALVGLLTRSTIAALLLTILFWFMLFILNSGDAVLVSLKAQLDLKHEALTRQVEQVRTSTGKLILRKKEKSGEEVSKDYVPTDEEIAKFNPWFTTLVDKRDDAAESLKKLKPWSKSLFAVKTMLPKTNETILLLERSLYSIQDLKSAQARIEEKNPDQTAPKSEHTAESNNTKNTDDAKRSATVNVDQRDVKLKTQEAYRSRSAWWILGTSFAYEAFLLLLSTILFSRRDF